jgi:magnesium transporter
LITLHDGELKILKKFVKRYSESAKLRREVMSKGMGFLLYEILDGLFDEHFPMIDQMEKRMDTLERDVFSLKVGQKDMLRDILGLKKDLITFERTIGPLRAVIPQLEYKNDKFIPEGLEVYFDDIVDKVEKIWATLSNQREVVTLLQDTNEAVISHTTNNVIKILTVFSVIMLPITFITGFFGMNVQFPANIGLHDLSYIWVSAGMLGVVVLMLLFFKLKKWI